MIVWLASYPRSGNTLARLALFYLFGHRSGSIYPAGAAASTGRQRRLRSLVDRRPLALLDALEGPAFVKTHELRHADDDRPAVVVVRDGRDALVSYAHFLGNERGETGEHERLLGELLEGPGGSIGTWSVSVEAWRRRSAPTGIVRYEDLMSDPGAAIREAAEEAGVRLGPPRGEIPGFEELRDDSPSLFRRGRAGSWRDEMPPGLEDRFWRRHGATMAALGYERGPSGQ